MGTSVYTLRISRIVFAREFFFMDVYVLNNTPYALTMKRGRHPSDARRYRLELGVGETAKEAYERWYAVLDRCQDCHNNVDLLNKALDSLLER